MSEAQRPQAPKVEPKFSEAPWEELFQGFFVMALPLGCLVLVEGEGVTFIPHMPREGFPTSVKGGE